MDYQNGWTWHDGATTEQIEDTANGAAILRLANEARSLYDSIPDPRRHEYDDNYRDEPEFDTDEEFEAFKAQQSKGIQSKWGQIAAIEEMMGSRGARFCRPYEQYNEEEKLMEYLDNRGDYNGY